MSRSCRLNLCVHLIGYFSFRSVNLNRSVLVSLFLLLFLASFTFLKYPVIVYVVICVINLWFSSPSFYFFRKQISLLPIFQGFRLRPLPVDSIFFWSYFGSFGYGSVQY